MILSLPGAAMRAPREAVHCFRTTPELPRRVAFQIVAVLALVFAALLPASPGKAQGIALLRDPDIEHALGQLARPVLQAAGLNPNRVRILVVDAGSFNAFVIDQKTIFLNYGLILKVTKPEMLQAVIAHEAAHITNGHIGRRMQNLRSAGTAAGFGTALAILAAAAGAGEAAIGVAVGTQSSAFRNFLSHTRAEEASADRSAIGFLTRASIDPRGMVELHALFAGQEVLSAASQDPYVRSHPLTRDRLRAAQAYAAANAIDAPPSQDAAYWLARAQGKLSAFKRAPKWTKRRLRSETYSDLKLMRSAVAAFRENKYSSAVATMQKLLAARPNDAFYHELMGQIYYENRQWAQARASYQRAVNLAPQDPLTLASLGRAQLAAGSPREALKTMEKARLRDFRNAKLLRDMSLAYAQTGQTGMAAVVTAERYALRGRLKDAGIHAKRAMGALPEGSPAWRRAQDVYIAYEQDKKRNKK